MTFFPTATLGRLCARKGVTPALRQWVLVTEAGGYNCYARLGAAAKHNAYDFISRHGPLVHASKNNAIFSTGTISCPLLVTLSSLLNAGVEVCVLEAFGMKSDMALLEQLSEMQVDEPTLEERIDIGISASCSGIPLFTCLNEGKVFPLLHMAGFGNGSVTLERDLNANTRVRTMVYPTLSHHIKSLLHISYDVPVTMSGIYRKEAPIERFLGDIEDVEEEDLYGYRVEQQYFGKASLSLMMTNPPLSSAALPENVLCRYLCHKDIYININFFLLPVRVWQRAIFRECSKRSKHQETEPFSTTIEHFRSLELEIFQLCEARQLKRSATFCHGSAQRKFFYKLSKTR